MIQLLSRPSIIVLLAVSAAALFLGAGCANAPTAAQASEAELAGSAAALAVQVAAPTAAPYVETIAAAIRSLPAATTPPAPAAVQSVAAQWTAALPISATAKSAAVATAVSKYTAALPDLQKTANTAQAVEDFADGFGGGVATGEAP